MALPPFKNRRGRTIRFDSFTRRLNVDINLLRAAPAKQPASVNKKQHQNDDYEDRQHRDNARTSAAATILSHEGFLLLRETSVGGFRGNSELIVTTGFRYRQRKQKQKETRAPMAPVSINSDRD